MSFVIRGARRRPRSLSGMLPPAIAFIVLMMAAGCTAILAQGGKSPVVRLDYEKYTLPNGLDVILRRDNRLPIVAVNLWYHVGPANETAGRTGFAHLFEHMM